MATIPSKQLHRIGTYDELLVNLSDREIGYDPSTKTLYIKDNGELVSCAGNFVELPNAVSLLMGYEREPGTYAYDWKTLESIEPIPNNPLNLWSRLSGKGFYAEVARMDEKGRNISHMLDVVGIGLVYYGETTYDEVAELSNTYKHIYVDIPLDDIHIYMPLVETGETSFTFSSVLSNARYCSTSISEDGWSNVDITSLWPTIDTVVDSESTNPVENRAIADALDLKADKVQGATSGNLASLDGSGNLLDSGKNIADFATSSQGATADTAIQDVKVNGVSLEKDSNNAVDVPVPTGSDSNPSMDGTARAGSSMQWSRGDHVHPTDTSREAVANKDSTIPNNPVSGHYPTTGAVQEFVNSSVATNTATFRGNFTLADLGLTYPATNAQIASSLNSHTWPSGETPTNNDYVYVEIQNPETTGIDDKVERFKYDGSSWAYEYTLNNSSFTTAEKAALESGIDSTKVTEYTAHVNDSSIHVTTSDKEAWNGKQDAISTDTDSSAFDDNTTIATGYGSNKIHLNVASRLWTYIKSKIYGICSPYSKVLFTSDRYMKLASIQKINATCYVTISNPYNGVVIKAELLTQANGTASVRGSIISLPKYAREKYDAASYPTIYACLDSSSTPNMFTFVLDMGSSTADKMRNFIAEFEGVVFSAGEWDYPYGSGSISTISQYGTILNPDYSLNIEDGPFVRYDTASQGLNSTQQANARTNIGLGNVVNTGDSATPTQNGPEKFTTGGAYTELAKKVDKVSGKGLSTNDFTTELKNKLDGIAAGAEVNVQANWNQTDTSADDFIQGKPQNLVKVDSQQTYFYAEYPVYVGQNHFTQLCGVTARPTNNRNYMLWNNVSQHYYGNSVDVNSWKPTDEHKSQLLILKNDNTLHASVTYSYGHNSSKSVNVPYGKCAIFSYPGYGTNDYWEWVDGICQSLTPSDVGLGNVGNFKAVSTVANQGLKPTEQQNARTNIGLGNVDNTSDATKKTNFTGTIESSNTGFVTGDAAYTAIHTASHQITDYNHRNCGYHYCSYFSKENTVIAQIDTERDKSTVSGTNAQIKICFDSTNAELYLQMDLVDRGSNYNYQAGGVEVWSKTDYTPVTSSTYSGNNNYFKAQVIDFSYAPVSYKFGSIPSYTSSMYDGRGRVTWDLKLVGMMAGTSDIFMRLVYITLDYRYSSPYYYGMVKVDTYPVYDNL